MFRRRKHCPTVQALHDRYIGRSPRKRLWLAWERVRSRLTVWWLRYGIWLPMVPIVYVIIAMLRYAFRNPELTATQVLLHMHDALLLH